MFIGVYLVLTVLIGGSTRRNTISYTVENQISDDGLEFQETQILAPAQRVFIDIMDEAAANDETFQSVNFFIITVPIPGV